MKIVEKTNGMDVSGAKMPAEPTLASKGEQEKGHLMHGPGFRAYLKMTMQKLERFSGDVPTQGRRRGLEQYSIPRGYMPYSDINARRGRRGAFSFPSPTSQSPAESVPASASAQGSDLQKVTDGMNAVTLRSESSFGPIRTGRSILRPPSVPR